MRNSVRTTLLVALALLVTLPVEAATTRQSSGLGRPIGDAAQMAGDIDSPGDPFSPAVDQAGRTGRAFRGFSCYFIGEGGIIMVGLNNYTGKPLPAGSVVTVYVQPGNLKKTYVLTKPWKPNGSFGMNMESDGSILGEECQVTVAMAREPAFTHTTVTEVDPSKVP